MYNSRRPRTRHLSTAARATSSTALPSLREGRPSTAGEGAPLAAPPSIVQPTSAPNAGYTLIEVVISTLIVGGVLVGALNVLGSSAKTQRLFAKKVANPAVGQQLMAEILAQPYEDPDEPQGTLGLETGESNVTRADFDDIDDYDNWYADGAKLKDGSNAPGLNGWQRQATVKYYDLATGATTTADTGVKLITVTATAPDGVEHQCTALRSKWGQLEQAPAVDTTAVTYIDAELKIGSSGKKIRAATPIPNHASGP